MPVGHYTGTPSISIPLFELEGHTLSLPLSLSYHASGIKVSEIGSWVGMSFFRHKSSKRSFQMKMILVTVVNPLWLLIYLRFFTS